MLQPKPSPPITWLKMLVDPDLTRVPLSCIPPITAAGLAVDEPRL
jgi:hypothetical protein